MKRDPVIHYAGRLVYPTKGGRSCVTVLGGWAACCSGRRAEKIRDEGTHTHDAAKVTCKACLRNIARSKTATCWNCKRAGKATSVPEAGDLCAACVDAGVTP